eukprot:SAG31_NODE_889_length_11203_cov_7.409042_6_plen_110_part_00
MLFLYSKALANNRSAQNCKIEHVMMMDLLDPLRVLHCPNYLATHSFMLHMIQYVYQERDTGLKFRSDQSVVPVAWYDASDDQDRADSIALSVGVLCVCVCALSLQQSDF